LFNGHCLFLGVNTFFAIGQPHSLQTIPISPKSLVIVFLDGHVSHIKARFFANSVCVLVGLFAILHASIIVIQIKNL
jgi:prepilin-type processing-associated H-X9-DG protein